MTKHVMVVFGTRPEAIKMAPVVQALKATPGFSTSVVVTAQHREMLDQVLGLFGIVPDVDLDLMRPGQGLDALFARVLTGVGDAISARQPDLVLVHGDTTTALAAGLATFHAKVPLGHVEAGLRTGNMQAPWPEEANRRLIAPMASLHFAPTELASQNLLNEGIHGSDVFVTGNTVIDALLWAKARLDTDSSIHDAVTAHLPWLDPSKRLVLVTGHRRENFGASFDQICQALKNLASRGDIQVVYPVHLNPKVREPVERILRGLENVFLIEPLEYVPFAYLMAKSHLIITDSGGIQEEAPALGKPVLVARETTERPEAIEAGTAQLVGTDTGRIVEAASRLLDDPVAYRQMASANNPFGDGKAAKRIAAIVARS
jgi:UDP-N-acetylglucosamine 2-epimerase